MLIAIDGFEASAKSRVGVGRLEVEVLKKLAEIDKKNTYRIYTPRKPQDDLPRQTDFWQYRIPMFKRLWSQLALSYYTKTDRPKPDVFFAPVHYAPRYISIPVVLGIMDLSFLFFPDMFKKRDLFKLANWTSYSIKKAKHIISISKSTKNDILDQYGVNSGKVSVVYPGSSLVEVTNKNSKAQMSNVKNIMKKYKISSQYILYVGTLQPRKNIVRLIESFHMIKNMKQNKWSDLKLVIVGKKGWLYETIFAKVKELELEDSVLFTGFVPDKDLPTVYSGAECFCLVSLYEGFGFPVLEAMQSQTPVVASNISSLPELVGDAGVLVDPEDTADIANGIIKVLELKPSDRKKLIAMGEKQASKFTWEKTARETLQILEEVGGSNK